jgi:hypothetical protein
MNENINKFESVIKKCTQCVHGKNILAKLKQKKYIDFNFEILILNYLQFLEEMNRDLNAKIEKFIKYKEFIKNLKHPFSSQSKFESSILEEFLYHLFKEFESENIKVGGIKAYSSIYFSPPNLEEFKKKNFLKINTKDQDFAIYKKVVLNDENESYEIFVPIVAIECKTYLDKTMLEGSVATAEKIKYGNPHCKFYIVTETYEVDFKVDPATSRIDNIFVLKKGGRSKRDGIIDKSVVKFLYEEVKNFIFSDWSDIKSNIENLGRIFK